jgi:hypothetical protein
MKPFNFRILLLLLFVLSILTGCRSTREENEEIFQARVPVTITGIEIATMTDAEDVVASSSFLTKAAIKAPVAGYLEDVNITPGDLVTKNKRIFSLKTKEAAALVFDSLNPLSFSGLIHVTSSASGIVISVDHSIGDYVMEGDQLCSIALPGSLVFIVEVPYELGSYIISGCTYSIELPDGKKLDAVLKSRLPGVTSTSQTQRFVFQLTQIMNLPENLLVKVRIVKHVIEKAILLPKSCVLSDEVMKHFWVMKVVNDSLAVRVDVNRGLVQDDKVQIKDPLFSPSDRFLSSGSYGIGDTASIQITNKKR